MDGGSTILVLSSVFVEGQELLAYAILVGPHFYSSRHYATICDRDKILAIKFAITEFPGFRVGGITPDEDSHALGHAVDPPGERLAVDHEAHRAACDPAVLP